MLMGAWYCFMFSFVTKVIKKKKPQGIAEQKRPRTHTHTYTQHIHTHTVTHLQNQHKLKTGSHQSLIYSHINVLTQFYSIGFFSQPMQPNRPIPHGELITVRLIRFLYMCIQMIIFHPNNITPCSALADLLCALLSFVMQRNPLSRSRARARPASNIPPEIVELLTVCTCFILFKY